MHRTVYASHGLVFEVAAGSPELDGRLGSAMPPGARASSGTAVRGRFAVHAAGPCRCGQSHAEYVVTRGRVAVARSGHAAAALQLLRAEIKLWIAAHARSWVFVHAGVVGWNGHAVVLPGSTHAGKTTLVHALLRAGATYYSDDMAVLDRRGLVHPYPLPLGLRDGSSAGATGGPQRDLPASALGAPVATATIPVGLVVITRYRRSTQWRPRGLSRGAAVLELMAHTVGARRRPEFSLGTLGAACGPASCWRGDRGEPHEIVDFVRRRLGPLGQENHVMRV